MKSLFSLWFEVLLLTVSVAPENFDEAGPSNLTQTFFISEIFDKYGNNNIMTYEGFEHLLENLGLGKLKFETKHDVSIHKVNGTFREFHDELSLHRHEHNGNDSDGKEENGDDGTRQKRNLKKEENAKILMRKCLTAQDILVTFGLKPYHEVVISPSKYLQICPAIVYELDQKLCHQEEVKEMKWKKEERYLVWIYASISIIIMGVSGLLCVLVVLFVRKDHLPSFLQFLVSLAVGTLSGDALIHLIPQIFSSDGKPGSEVKIILRGTVTLSAIFIFFLIENTLKRLRNKKTVEERKELGMMLSPFDSHGHHHNHSKDVDGIKTVAWIAIIGDILHNVTDGLAIGAAFGSSLSSGFASSIAIFCHELPHELGDYAILLTSGMSVKKSLLYNVLSSIFSFTGMVAGVLLGEIEDASLWINAFTAGSFLYIALSDLVPEMTIMQVNCSHKNLFVQILGLLAGGALMFIVALYEHQIESLLLEIHSTDRNYNISKSKALSLNRRLTRSDYCLIELDVTKVFYSVFKTKIFY